MPPLPDTTTDLWLDVAISRNCHLTPVMNVVGFAADGVVSVMLLWRGVLRVRGVSITPRFCRADHISNPDHDSN